VDGWVDKRRKKQEEEEPRITKKERKERLFRGFGCCFFSKLLFSLSLFLSHWLFISSVERVDSTQELTTSIIGDGWVGKKKEEKAATPAVPVSQKRIYLFIYFYIFSLNHTASFRLGLRKQLFSLSLSLSPIPHT
jgi:hypothetical protein